MGAHLQKATVVLTVLADEDRLHRGFHVVVDAPCAGALEEGEAALVRVEHHLLRLARIGPHEHHPAMAQGSGPPWLGRAAEHWSASGGHARSWCRPSREQA